VLLKVATQCEKVETTPPSTHLTRDWVV